MKIQSAYTQYEYDIEIYVPENINENCPVYYILDGLSYYQLAKETVRLQSLNSIKTKVEKAVIVAICHQKEDMRARRFFDFTGPAEKYAYPERMKNNIPADVGGAEAFHRFIELECKPRIYEALSYTPKKEILFGHSLSGYYALWTLLHYPDSFQGYIAISPSVWWNDNELLKRVQEKQPLTPSSVFMAVGEQEIVILDDAKEFYYRIQPYMKNSDFYEGLEENHASIVPHSISRAFRFIFNCQ